MFDLHALQDPVYSMAPSKPAGPVAAPMTNPVMGMAQALAAINKIHPLAGGADEFYKMMSDPNQNSSPNVMHIYTRGNGGSSESPASSDYYNDMISGSDWSKIQQILGNPVYGSNAGGVSTSANPANQNASLGQSL